MPVYVYFNIKRCLATCTLSILSGPYMVRQAAVQDSAAVARPGRATTRRCLCGFRILGAVETLAPEGSRDAFFRTTAALGVAKVVFLDGATPKV